jgi:ribonuclease P protein subunit POP4
MQKLLRDELIGLEVRVVESTNKNVVGFSGRIVDETRNTLKIETKSGAEKTLVKEQCIFLIKYGGKWVKVDGRELVSRPEDRIKKKLKWW